MCRELPSDVDDDALTSLSLKTVCYNPWHVATRDRACRAGYKCTRQPLKPVVTIRGDQFYIDDQPTYKGRTWNGHKSRVCCSNYRMVQGIFDDAESRNGETLGL